MSRQPIRVLIVEDNSTDQDMLRGMLNKTNEVVFEVFVADRLTTAFRFFSDNTPQLIVLDLFLPESKGIDTLKKIRKKVPDIPVIALTRFDDEHVGITAVREGAQDYLVKGQFDRNVIQRSIRHALERTRAEEAIRFKNMELSLMNKELQEAHRLKSVFLANMSHELRTPLNAVIGFGNILLKGMSGPVNENQKKQLKTIKNNGEHLLQLINEMLDVSKIEAGKVELVDERFPLQKLLEEIQDVFVPLVESKDLDFRIQLLDDCHLVSDRGRLKQILMNLVNNAVKFTEKGGVTIVGDTTRKGYVILTVVDTGIGIRQENMDMLFIPFHQLDMSLTKKYQGTGLGLHLSQKLAKLLGGEITAESQYRKGSQFSLTIPRKRTGAKV
ncbi:MAG: ATP-binding protein [Desulfobacterales bacterium]|nr:ATP-binding protein [Desulfobacterales bacterium]